MVASGGAPARCHGLHSCEDMINECIPRECVAMACHSPVRSDAAMAPLPSRGHDAHAVWL